MQFLGDRCYPNNSGLGLILDIYAQTTATHNVSRVTAEVRYFGDPSIATDVTRATADMQRIGESDYWTHAFPRSNQRNARQPDSTRIYFGGSGRACVQPRRSGTRLGHDYILNPSLHFYRRSKGKPTYCNPSINSYANPAPGPNEEKERG